MPYPFDAVIPGQPLGGQTQVRPLQGPGGGVGQGAMQAPVNQGFQPQQPVPGLVNNYQQVLQQGLPGQRMGNAGNQGWAGGYLGAPGVQGGFGAIMKGNQFDPNRLQGLLQDRSPQGMAGTLNGLGGGFRPY